MTDRPMLHAVTSIIAAGLALAACGGDESATDTVSAPTTVVSSTDAPVAASTTPLAASPSSAPAPTTAPSSTGAPAVTDGEGVDDPDTCEEAIAYIEGLAGEGLELLEMPQDDALDVMGAMNVLSATCEPDAALEFLQRPDIVEFMN